LTEDLNGKNNQIRLLESRAVSAEKLNSDYSVQLTEMSTALDGLTKANIELEAANEKSQARIAQLQREASDLSPRGKTSATGTPSRKKSAKGFDTQPDIALLETQLLVQHYAQQLEEKDRALSHATEVNRIQAGEIEDLSRRFEEVLSSQAAGLNANELTGEGDEYAIQLQAELYRFKEANASLEAEMGRLRGEVSAANDKLQSTGRKGMKFPVAGIDSPSHSPTSARLQDLLGSSGPPTPEVSPKAKHRTSSSVAALQTQIDGLTADLQRSQDCLIQADEERNELRDRIVAVEGARDDAVRENELLASRISAKTHEIFKLKEGVRLVKSQYI
jgi:chromosome segregation ATPase